MFVEPPTKEKKKNKKTENHKQEGSPYIHTYTYHATYFQSPRTRGVLAAFHRPSTAPTIRPFVFVVLKKKKLKGKKLFAFFSFKEQKMRFDLIEEKTPQLKLTVA